MAMADLTPAQIAEDAINLFIEYRDVHDYDEDNAKAAAILDVVEGASVNMVEVRDDLAGST
jgi:hypothetical protein